MASASTALRAPEGALHGASIIREIKASRIEFVVSVPDITTSEGLLRPLAQATDPRLIRSARKTKASASAPACPIAGGARCS